jgi:hypothetical protein
MEDWGLSMQIERITQSYNYVRVASVDLLPQLHDSCFHGSQKYYNFFIAITLQGCFDERQFKRIGTRNFSR